jgi:hypothetical protein
MVKANFGRISEKDISQLDWPSGPLAKSPWICAECVWKDIAATEVVFLQTPACLRKNMQIDKFSGTVFQIIPYR